jgi:hypothetical protein
MCTPQKEVMQLGEDAARHLNINQADRVCVSVTLMHSFGIATAVAAAFSRGACLVLPAGAPSPFALFVFCPPFSCQNALCPGP